MEKHGFFEDNEGNRSMNRLLSFVIVVVFLIGWAITCIAKHEFLPWNEGHVFGLLAVTAPKVVQSIFEKKQPGIFKEK